METDENSIESGTRSVQIMFKMPTAFMDRFDRIAEAFGYTRTEAVREAMRRFEFELEEDLSERPEEITKKMQSVMEGVIGPLIKMGQQAQKTHLAQRPMPEIVPKKLSSEVREQK